MKTYNKLGFILLALIILFFTVYFIFRNEIKIYAFQQTVENSPADEFCIIHSYSVRNKTILDDGRDLNIREKWNKMGDDGLYLALFLKDDALLKVVELPREFGEATRKSNHKQCKSL